MAREPSLVTKFLVFAWMIDLSSPFANLALKFSRLDAMELLTSSSVAKSGVGGSDCMNLSGVACDAARAVSLNISAESKLSSPTSVCSPFYFSTSSIISRTRRFVKYLTTREEKTYFARQGIARMNAMATTKGECPW